MNCRARWSRSSGFEGRSPRVPKSSGVPTSPCPNRCCQTRFTATRLVSGFWSLVSQSASCARPLTSGPISGGCGAMIETNPRGTVSPRLMSIAANADRHRAGMLVIVHRHRQRRARNGVLLQSRDFLLQLCEPLLDLLEVRSWNQAFASGFSSPALPASAGFAPFFKAVPLRLEPFLLFHPGRRASSRAPERHRRRPGRLIRADAGSSP